MAGHSKWHNIRHRKAAVDAKKTANFQKISNAISVAVKHGGTDLSTNVRLSSALAQAKTFNVPKDVIERAINKASEVPEGLEDAVYEGYGTQGVAVVVETLTNNRSRTAPRMRHIFSKYGAGLGTSGSVTWMFDAFAVLKLGAGREQEERVLEVMLEHELEGDVQDAGKHGLRVKCDPKLGGRMRDALLAADIPVESFELDRAPQTYVDLTDDDKIQSFFTMLDALEDNDDVQRVFHNATIYGKPLNEEDGVDA